MMIIVMQLQSIIYSYLLFTGWGKKRFNSYVILWRISFKRKNSIFSSASSASTISNYIFKIPYTVHICSTFSNWHLIRLRSQFCFALKRHYASIFDVVYTCSLMFSKWVASFVQFSNRAQKCHGAVAIVPTLLLYGKFSSCVTCA